MMPEGDSPMLMNPGDEIWTEEEVIEFGLAGEEDYCDLETVETTIDLPMIPEVTETAELVYLDDAESASPETDSSGATKKSGRVRKKSARLMEMEESDQLEQQVLHRHSRASARRSRGSEQIVREIPASSLGDEHPVSAGFEKPVKVRFSLGAKRDEAEVLPGTPKSRSKRDRRKSAAEVKTESDEELVVDEPTAVISSQSSDQSLVLRMKLNMDPSGVSAFIPAQDSHQHSPKKSKRSPRVKIEDEQLSLPEITAGSHQLGGQMMPAGGVAEGNVGGFATSRKHHRKRAHDDVINDDQMESTFAETDNLPVIKQTYSVKAAKQLKESSKPKKKRQKGYTAYMLWCGTQRLKLMSVNPGIDFATLSKTLGDMWQTVPEKEKMVWRRKARKMAKKGTSVISTGRVKDGVPVRGRPPGIHSGTRGRPPLHGTKYRASALDDTSSLHFKVVGTGPLDAAAHLKLLGESLSVIGARLQEHKGQIAVQGSLSVLLDSMLCALGPLMCLTTHVPELNGCEERVHASTLNNIAYIMPGVG